MKAHVPLIPSPSRDRVTHLKRALALLAVTFVLDRLFTVVAGPEGLLTPFGPVHVATLALGFTALALRLVVTFVLLPLTVWRMTRHAEADDA